MAGRFAYWKVSAAPWISAVFATVGTLPSVGPPRASNRDWRRAGNILRTLYPGLLEPGETFERPSGGLLGPSISEVPSAALTWRGAGEQAERLADVGQGFARGRGVAGCGAVLKESVAVSRALSLGSVARAAGEGLSAPHLRTQRTPGSLIERYATSGGEGHRVARNIPNARLSAGSGLGRFNRSAAAELHGGGRSLFSRRARFR